MRKLTRPVRKIPTVREGLGIYTIPHMLAYATEKFADRTAYLMNRKDEVSELKYWQVGELVKRLARYLRELGFEKGDHIALLGENRPEWPIGYFAISWMGGVVVPLDARASLDTHRFILDFAEVKGIIVSENYLSDIKEVQKELPNLKHIIPMGEIYEIYNKYSKGMEMESVSPDDLLEILFTSGTTGDPKGVMLTHRNIMSNVEDIYRSIDVGPEDRTFSILPIHHSYECTAGQITPIYVGASIFFARSLKPTEMLEDLKIARPTFWLNVPLILEKLYVRIRKQIDSQTGFRKILTKLLPKKVIGRKVRERLGLDRLRYLVSGGAALPRWVSKGLEELGFPIIQGYGLSEASPLISVNPPSNPKNESVGMIIPSVDVEIRDPDGEGNGEIVAKGPNIMLGYYKNESATKETFTTDGWLLTGDVGYFDEDGYLYITGRKKFVIVTKGGKNVFPEEIEEKLTKSIYIEEALVFSPDDERILALVYPNLEEVNIALRKMGKEFNDDNVWELLKREVDEVNSSLEPYKKIRHFAIIYEEFEKTTTRKIKRHLYRNINLSSDTKVLKG